MQDAQAWGMTRSLQKQAMAIIAIVRLMPGIRVASIRKAPAPRNPVTAIIRRVRESSPVSRVTAGVTRPQKSEPRPLKNSGITA